MTTHEIGMSIWHFTEVCIQSAVEEDTVFDIIEQDIIEQDIVVESIGASFDDWQCSPEMLILTQKAVLMHRHLDVGWAEIALVIELLVEIELLREQNHHLQQRLSGFTDV
jgi:chaperone modulatory protein CbpM